MGIVEEIAKSGSVSANPFGLPRNADCATLVGGGGAEPVAFGSGKYYALCGFAGILSCGLTHTAIVPLDLIKCRIQVNPEKYKGIVGGFRTTLAEEGVRALGKGWAPTAIGYSLQGLGKFGFYELFKIMYADALGEEKAYLYRTGLYLAASASAEFFADILLAPMEATKVRIQTSPGAPPTLRGCAPMIYRTEGLAGFYKGLPPLWMRQIPYTMMKFACFERTVELLYKHVVPKPREACSKSEQLVVTFVAGYIAGVFCAIVSHPADTIVSKLNQDAGASAVDILKKLGPVGVWGGLVPRIIMIGTLTALQWFIYDSAKVVLNLPRPPPPSLPASLKAKMEGVAYKVGEEAKDFKKGAEQKAYEFKNAAEQKAYDMMSAAEKKAYDLKKAAEQKAHDLKKAADPYVKDAQDKAQQKYQEAQQRGREVAHDVRQRGRAMAHDAQQKLGDSIESASKTVGEKIESAGKKVGEETKKAGW